MFAIGNVWHAPSPQRLNYSGNGISVTGNQDRFATVFVDLSNQLLRVFSVNLSDLQLKCVSERLHGLLRAPVLSRENFANP